MQAEGGLHGYYILYYDTMMIRMMTGTGALTVALAVDSPAMGHCGTCLLDFQQFPFLVHFGVNLTACNCPSIVCEIIPSVP